jgi:hypothetical protein
MTKLETLLDALNASQVTLTRDFHLDHGHVGDHAIRGKFGHVYTDGDGYLLCVHTNESARRWFAIKGKLSFCRLTQDGDDAGALHLDHLPTPAEAELIRDALGIRKRRELTPEALAKARASMERCRAGLNGGLPSADRV